MLPRPPRSTLTDTLCPSTRSSDLGNSSRALARGRHAFELAREHALNRRQFGQPLVNFQGLQWKFAEMKIKAEAAQLLLYRAALGADTGFPSPQDTAIAKTACTRPGCATIGRAT